MQSDEEFRREIAVEAALALHWRVLFIKDDHCLRICLLIFLDFLANASQLDPGVVPFVRPWSWQTLLHYLLANATVPEEHHFSAEFIALLNSITQELVASGGAVYRDNPIFAAFAHILDCRAAALELDGLLDEDLIVALHGINVGVDMGLAMQVGFELFSGKWFLLICFFVL